MMTRRCRLSGCVEEPREAAAHRMSGGMLGSEAARG